jgi:hypothetical protein
MKRILASPILFTVSAALLVLAFFLPDLLGPLVGTAISAVIILLAMAFYNWCYRQDMSAATGCKKGSDNGEPPS